MFRSMSKSVRMKNAIRRAVRISAPHVQLLEDRRLLSVAASTPFTGTPFIPNQRIEAEYFDAGGEGVAYHDTTPKDLSIGGANYRPGEAVDVQAGGSNGYDVGYAVAGEWLNYTVNIPQAGNYTLQASVANAAAGGQFHAELGGVNRTGAMAVPNTGNWQVYKTVTSATFSLSAGRQVMRIALDHNASVPAVGNFDWFMLVPAPGAKPSSTPFHGTPIPVGHIIEAEDFDKGGEGLAYHDSTPTNLGGATYRPGEAVDLQSGGDSSNGFYIGYTVAGEWLNYTISVPETGQYVLAGRVACIAAGASFHATFDGSLSTNAVAIPKTPTWTSWHTALSNAVTLTAGTHVMRIAMDHNASGIPSAGNYDWFQLIETAGPASFNWKPAAPAPARQFEGFGRMVNGKLYTFGGYTGVNPFGATETVQSYDPVSGVWTSLGNIPIPETHCGVAVDEQAGIIYFVGGLRGLYPGTATTDVYSYNTKSNTWTRLPSLPMPLAAGEADLVNGKLHYLGGNIGQDRSTDSGIHLVLDLSAVAAGTATWQTAADLPDPRDHFSSVVLNGQIYTFGGEVGHDTLHLQQTDAHRYDPSTDTWTPIASLPIPRSHAESSAFVSNGKIFVAGGQVDDFLATATMLEYDPAADRWYLLPNLPMPLEGTIVQASGDKLIVTTGYDGISGNASSATWVGQWPSP
ncbi:MAG: Kelch repeat-containing protein [Phycisphaerales bacterium]|nr:Kelch repeat-containing protein [Phycisphaerales bacterium]